MKKALSMIGTLLIIVGMILCMFPWISKIQSQFAYFKAIKQYEESYVKGDYIDLINVLNQYNEKIFEDKQSDLKDPFDYEVSSIDLKPYGIKDDLIGTIWIPRMNIELPLIWGASRPNMKKGATLMGQTSFPLGNDNSHSVIAAHRGHGQGHPMFREIQKLQKGDKIEIRLPWTILDYKVVSTAVISPDDIDAIRIQEHDNMITLSSCHPYRINTLRYIVNADYEGSVDVINHADDLSHLSKEIKNDDIGTDSSNRDIFIEDHLPYLGILLFIVMLFKTYRRLKHEKND